MTADLRRLVVYSRPGCHLCDVLLEALVPMTEAAGVAVQVVDISGDLALERDYGTRIPVVEYQGRELCRYRLDADRVAAVLESVPRPSF